MLPQFHFIFWHVYQLNKPSSIHLLYSSTNQRTIEMLKQLCIDSVFRSKIAKTFLNLCPLINIPDHLIAMMISYTENTGHVVKQKWKNQSLSIFDKNIFIEQTPDNPTIFYGQSDYGIHS